MTQPICQINKETRSKCKYCRYTRCENLGGMVKAWVISTQIKKIPRQKGNHRVLKKDRTEILSLIKEMTEKDIETPLVDSEVILKNIMLLYSYILQNNFLFVMLLTTHSFYLKLTEDVKRDINSNNRTISKTTMASLEMTLNQQVLHHAMSFDGFTKLKHTIRVSSTYKKCHN